MVNYRNVTIAVVGLFLSVSFLASTGVAAEKDGVMMKNGRVQKLQEGKDIGPMDRMTTMANGTKVMMNGKIMTKDGQQSQLEEGQVMMLDGKLIDSKGSSK
jgi:cytochrome b